MQDVETGQQSEADRLRHQRKGPGDQRLRSDDRRQRRQHDERQQQRRRRQAVEQLAACDLRAGEQIGALTEIVQEQGGKHHREPADPDRPGAEMPEISIHCLAAGDDQDQHAEQQHRLAHAGVDKERQSIERIERHQDLRLARDLRDAEAGDDDEPHDQHRPEESADVRGALELDGEQTGQQPQRDRDDEGSEGRRGDVEPLDRREHADRRRDHAVAEQQAGAQHQRPQQHLGAPVLVLMQQAVEREHAAFAVVLGAQHQKRVFDRDDQNDRPYRQRDRAEDVVGRRRNAGRT